MFGAIVGMLIQSSDELSGGHAEFPSIISQNGKNDLKVKVNDPYVQYQYGRTDWQIQMDRCRQRQYPFRM